MGLRLIFLGPQGSGKGTQASRLARLMGVPHVSTGVMLRQAVADGTELGKKADAIMQAGDLVPDELVVAMVGERLSQPDAACGYLLDGFPRNVAQAEALDGVLDKPLDAVVRLDVPHEELMKRMLLRAEAEGRADDTEEGISRRLEIYWEETAPLSDYYAKNGVVVHVVDGFGGIDEVFARVALTMAVE
ncbi:MAG: adenylate kinase [Acidimicrobiia bacterium]|nr:adenylate kinase [Acidimicrobiia bacterium]MDX2468738.1 adenylate kinase [Acidimicrobiia bacterium]